MSDTDYAALAHTCRMEAENRARQSIKAEDFALVLRDYALADAIDALLGERRVCDCGHLIAHHEDGALCHHCPCTVPLFDLTRENARLRAALTTLQEHLIELRRTQGDILVRPWDESKTPRCLHVDDLLAETDAALAKGE